MVADPNPFAAGAPTRCAQNPTAVVDDVARARVDDSSSAIDASSCTTRHVRVRATMRCASRPQVWRTTPAGTCRRLQLRCEALVQGKELLQRYRRRLHSGDVEVREIRDEESDEVAALLTDVFAEEMGTRYRPYLLQQVGNYVKDKRRASPDVVCLVAVHVERDSGQEHVVGTAEVSFEATTRSTYQLQPPDEHAYMCNLAVAETHRRMGCGSLLLASCEELAVLFGKEELYVHVRLVDEPARKMYRKTGYHTWKMEGPMMSIGRRRRALLRKKLTAG